MMAIHDNMMFNMNKNIYWVSFSSVSIYTLFYFKAKMLHDFLMFWSSTSLQKYFL